jgi:divalent metal cation (Fe/Co/Zn/Cd) transporter
MTSWLIAPANHLPFGQCSQRSSTAGLMDSALSTDDQATVQRVLQAHQEAGVRFHKLQTRQARASKFVSLHVQVPGAWTVHRGYQLAGLIASHIRQALPGAWVTTHPEPLGSPTSAPPQPAERHPSEG